MAKTIVEQVMAAHLVSGELVPGAEVALKIDHTLTQDATGTLAYLEFEAMGVERARPEVAVSYVDHNLPQTDFRNADDHRFLRTVAADTASTFRRRATASATRCIWSGSAPRGKPCWGPTATRPRPGAPGCWRLGPGGWTWPWRWPGSLSTWPCPKSWGCG